MVHVIFSNSIPKLPHDWLRPKAERLGIDKFPNSSKKNAMNATERSITKIVVQYNTDALPNLDNRDTRNRNA